MRLKQPKFWREDTLVSMLLSPLSALTYAAGLWRWNRPRTVSVPMPVICVGNLVAGGAGKTPVALALAGSLQSAGQKVAFLTRGYGGREPGPLQVDEARHGALEVGDEALLLARQSHAWVARDRVMGAEAASRSGADVLIMDDGFQDPALYKDLSLLVIDGAYGLGNERLLPAGPLREPPERGLARADAVVLIGADETGLLERLNPAIPILRAALMPVQGSERFTGKRVVAFAGIGRPEKFFGTLSDLGADLVHWEGFPDHHLYRRGEFERLINLAKQEDATPVTTRKDWVRLPEEARRLVDVLDVRLVWHQPGQVEAILGRVLDHA